MLAVKMTGPQLFSQASSLRVNNEKPEKGGQSKRIHPHGLKLILQGKKKEAIAYLNKYKDKQVNPEQTQMLVDLALDKPDAWKFDARTWPWKRTLPNTALKKDAPSDSSPSPSAEEPATSLRTSGCGKPSGRSILGLCSCLATTSTSTTQRLRRCSSSITTVARASPNGPS